MILPGVEDPRNLRQSEWDLKLGKIDEMEVRWCLSTLGSAEYILPVAQSTSVTPVSPYTRRRSLKMYWEAVIKRVWRCFWTPRSSELRDALGCRDRASLEMHLETEIEWTQRCIRGRDRASLEKHLETEIEWTQRWTWMQRSSEFGDALGDRERVNSEMHLEAVIERVWRYALGGRNRVNLEMHSEAVIERVWRCTCRLWSSEIGGVLEGGQSGGGSSGGRRDGSWDSIHWLTRNCGNVENWVQHDLPRDERLAGSGRQSILGWCSTRCMQYSVYAVLGVCCTRCMLYSVSTHDYGMER